MKQMLLAQLSKQAFFLNASNSLKLFQNFDTWLKTLNILTKYWFFLCVRVCHNTGKKKKK